MLKVIFLFKNKNNIKKIKTIHDILKVKKINHKIKLYVITFLYKITNKSLS